MWNERFRSLIIPIFSFILAVVVSGIIMALCGYNPFTAYSMIFYGAFGSARSITNTLIQATPLIMTGLGYMVSKKATLINLGIEGQLYETGENLNVTGFHELRDYIRRELNCEGEEL